MPAAPLRIGTRGSAMALFQAGLVRERLAAAHPDLAAAIEVVPIRTSGDREQSRRLAEIGGKGLFTKEIEEALLDRRIDLAVHSLKDVETFLPPGLEIACVLPRDDPREAFLSPRAASLGELPRGAVVGTSSLRRQAQLLRRRPDLEIVPLRGNVDTRIAKLAAGEVDATILALCGLVRLGREAAAREILSPAAMLPAIGQGALAIECRSEDLKLRERLLALNDRASGAAVAAERAMLAALDGSCKTPIGGLAEAAGGGLQIKGAIWKPDGSEEIAGERSGAMAEAEALGADLGRELRRRAGPGFGFD
jgi:hydroxymethylbilane synthase